MLNHGVKWPLLLLLCVAYGRDLYLEHPKGVECDAFVAQIEDVLCDEGKDVSSTLFKAHVKKVVEHAEELFGKQKPDFENKLMDLLKPDGPGTFKDCGTPEICELIIKHYDVEL